MPVFRNFIVWAIVVNGLMADAYYSCYEYNAANFSLKPNKHFDHIIYAKPRHISNNNMGTLLLLNKEKNVILFRQSIVCLADETSRKAQCGGEGDTGQVHFDKKMSLRFDTNSTLFISPGIQNTAVDNDDFKLTLQANHTPAKAQKISCPALVATLFNSECDGKYNEIRHHYVCYDTKKVVDIKGKKKLKYLGCDMGTKECKSIHKKHFGHYEDDSSTRAALTRCINSIPRNASQ